MKMTRGTLTIGLFMALFLEMLQGQGEPDHKGTRFLVGFLDNNSTLTPEVLVIPQTRDPVNVTLRLPPTDSNPAQLLSNRLEQDHVTIITLPADVRMSGTLTEAKGIEITSTADIVVYALNRANGSRDAFLALPTDSLGEEYYVACYQPAGPYVSQVGLVATDDNTRVDITVPALNKSMQVSVHNVTLEEGDTYTTYLDLYGSVQLESHSDLTGLKISASEPLVVLSGDTSTEHAQTITSWRDHIVEQLAPTKSWGRSFATVPFSTHHTGDVFRIIASHNDTNVEVRNNSTNTSYQLSESEHAEVNVTTRDFIAIESDKPVLVLQYLPGDGEGEGDQGGSFMLLVPPMEQREGQYLFSTVNGVQRVNLVITSAMREGLLLDGVRISNESQSWTLIESYLANYSAIQLVVDAGFHNLSHDSSDALFSAMGYGYPLGMGLKDLPMETDTVHLGRTLSPDTTRWGSSSTPKPTQRVKQFHEADNEVPEETGLTPTVIAVIVSLVTAVFFVIVCIIGFILAECVCRRDYTFRSAKVKPMT